MARKTDLVGRSGALKMPPALVDGLLGYAVAMAVGVAVFTRSAEVELDDSAHDQRGLGRVTSSIRMS